MNMVLKDCLKPLEQVKYWIATNQELKRKHPTYRTQLRKSINAKILRKKRFVFDGQDYPYFVHPYNRTWQNERAVEIPIALKFISESSPEDLLEVGNVLSHYIYSDHTVIDKYEKCRYRPVVNTDLFNYTPSRPYRKIISISTIEHIAWDEHRYGKDSNESSKTAVDAIEKIEGLIHRDGKYLISFPVGCNHVLDEFIFGEAYRRLKCLALRRVSLENEWVQEDLSEVKSCTYGDEYPTASAIVILGPI